MPTCPECGADVQAEDATCPVCGAETGTAQGQDPSIGQGAAASDGLQMERQAEDELDDPQNLLGAEYDPEQRKEIFERRFGIDVGDRTVDEYLDHLDKQDYSLNPGFWVFAVAEVAGILAFVVNLWGPTIPTQLFNMFYPAVSVLLALAILLDTRLVGQFRTWSRIRWVYVGLSAVPLVGHIAGALYALLRRLKHEQTVEHRRRLIDAGFDIQASHRQAD